MSSESYDLLLALMTDEELLNAEVRLREEKARQHREGGRVDEFSELLAIQAEWLRRAAEAESLL
jgi:hypothetical protein